MRHRFDQAANVVAYAIRTPTGSKTGSRKSVAQAPCRATIQARGRPKGPSPRRWIDALHQRVEHLREQSAALRQRVAALAEAWWRVDRAIFYMHDTLEMGLPSEVLDAWKRSWEEALGALPHYLGRD